MIERMNNRRGQKPNGTLPWTLSQPTLLIVRGTCRSDEWIGSSHCSHSEALEVWQTPEKWILLSSVQEHRADLTGCTKNTVCRFRHVYASSLFADSK